MITAIDSNVLLDILVADRSFAETSIAMVDAASARGSLVVCDLVYTEVSAHFNNQKDCDRFFERTAIGVQSLSRASLFLASRAWRAYRARGGKRERILPDFMIGAHAQLQASQLISRDRGFYGIAFPRLNVVNPARLA